MVPVYFSRKTPSTSSYLGPYVTYGRENMQGREDKLIVGGLAFGRNSMPLGVFTFTQTNLNIVQKRTGKPNYFPSFTVQVGVGF